MAKDEVLRDLMARAKSGDRDAMGEFLTRYEREVLIMVRARLPREIRGQYDSVDFVQAVWKSMILKLEGSTREFENERHLLQYLAGVVRNKVLEQHRRLTRTAKYSVRVEESLYVKWGDREQPLEIASSDPSPSQAAVERECFTRLTEERSPLEVKVLSMRREGWTFQDIAAETQVDERSLRRIIDAAWSRLERRS